MLMSKVTAMVHKWVQKIRFTNPEAQIDKDQNRRSKSWFHKSGHRDLVPARKSDEQKMNKRWSTHAHNDEKMANMNQMCESNESSTNHNLINQWIKWSSHTHTFSYLIQFQSNQTIINTQHWMRLTPTMTGDKLISAIACWTEGGRQAGRPTHTPTTDWLTDWHTEKKSETRARFGAKTHKTRAHAYKRAKVNKEKARAMNLQRVSASIRKK